MDRAALPEYIRVGIEHFEDHPSVDSPVEFVTPDPQRAEFSFRAAVKSTEGRDVEVDEVGPDVDSAWRNFEVSMSRAISAAAAEGAQGGEGGAS